MWRLRSRPCPSQRPPASADSLFLFPRGEPEITYSQYEMRKFCEAGDLVKAILLLAMQFDLTELLHYRVQ